MVVGIEKVILNQRFELGIGYLSEIVTGKLTRMKTCQKTEAGLLIKSL